jgi:uncharacterized protein (TIGR02231 family)
VSSDGCVWQRTGEDWRDVDLVFSTERRSLGVQPPLLTEDRVVSMRKSPVLQVSRREEVVQRAGARAEAASEPEVPGIDDGGEVRVLTAPAKTTVMSDGRPYRVPLFEFVSPAQSELVCYPELAECALLKTVQRNTAAQPLLAGPVDLVRQGGVVGRTTLLYTAPGEPFELSFGPDPALRVRRRKQRQKDEEQVLGSWTTTPYLVEVFTSNLGRTRKSFVVTERVAISEVERVQVTVSTANTTDQAKPDINGFVRWRVVLDSHERGFLQLSYTVKRHAEVAGASFD